jgi:very-short-patch-repair endonuclease
MSKRLTIDMFIKKANIVHNYYYLYDLVDFILTHDNIVITCPKHGEFIQRVNTHLAGHGCPICGDMKLRKNTEYFISKAKEIHGEKYDYSEVNYIDAHKYINIICLVHGTFFQKPNTHLKGSGCPCCNESIGEKRIADFLLKNSIKFEREKKFDDCKNVNKLAFDYFLPENNVLIEFDGAQHFSPNNHFGGLNKFNLQKINDNIKNEYAKSNNYNLLRIRFDQINQIEKILETYEPRIVQ